MKNNDLEQRYRAMVEDNVNVGKINDGLAFVQIEQTVIGLVSREAGVVILVRVGDDDVFELAVGHIVG